ncbi:hypothetical protein PVK06_040112 [Gossypium arboreum]|uniref:RNase H type-1 domain-containing protein n=1 Tax=Gossypium arboreum TaxID=29729 RepID=A0ABR0N6Q8_GOSAR|nr:hypothetical protein PVK06_040112 [Gossypium arboreum]
MAEIWNKLCTNGALQFVSRIVATEGVLRYGNGDWIMGYNIFLDEYSIFDVELWGIFDGMSLIQDKQFEGIMIQAYSLALVKTIQDSSFIDSNSILIRRNHQLLANIRDRVMQHIPRELDEIIDFITLHFFAKCCRSFTLSQAPSLALNHHCYSMNTTQVKTSKLELIKLTSLTAHP